MKGNVTLVKVDEMYNVLKSILPSAAYATLYMQDCSHYETSRIYLVVFPKQYI